MWAWLNDVFVPNVINKETSYYDNSNNFNYLLGQVRFRQQRSLPAGKFNQITLGLVKNLSNFISVKILM